MANDKNKRKFLEGELRYVEGKTNVTNLLSTISNELVKTDWADYKDKYGNEIWTFDSNREIELNDEFKKEDIKLQKILATTQILPSGLQTGVIKVLNGVTSNIDKVINLRLNGKEYKISLVVGDTKQIVASKLASYISTLEGFGDTVIDDEDDTLVLVSGDFAVYEISTNYDAGEYNKTGILSYTSVKKGAKTGRITVLGDSQIDGELEITINGDVVATLILKDETKLQIVQKIKDAILQETDFSKTYIDEERFVVFVEGEIDVESISLNTDALTVSTAKSEVRPIENVGIIEIYSTAFRDGIITVTATKVGETTARNITTTVEHGDTNSEVAEKIRISLVSNGFACNRTSNVLTISSITSCTTDIEIQDIPITVTVSEALPARGIGEIEILTPSYRNQNLGVVINGISYQIPILGEQTIEEVSSAILTYFLQFDENLFKYSSISEGIINLRGMIDVETISIDSDLDTSRLHTVSAIMETGEYMGRVTVLQPMTTNDNLVLTINGVSIVIALTDSDGISDIAEKIKDAVLDNTTDFLDTTIDEEDDSMVLIKGDESVESLKVSNIEIPAEDYDVVDNIIYGTGDAISGTNVGDNVLVKYKYQGEEFQRVCFKETLTTSGVSRGIAKLKSRPQGSITVYEDTILKVEQDIGVNNGDGIVYTFGKSPISMSNDSDHKLTIYKNFGDVGEEIIDPSEYTVDYYNGVIIFTGESQASNVITADYGVCTGIRGDTIPRNKYVILDNELIDTTQSGDLSELDVIVVVNYTWGIVYPATVQQVDETIDRVLLKTQVDTTKARNKTFTKDYYVEMRHTKSSRDKYLTGVELRFGSALDISGTTLDNDNCSEWVRAAWYDRNGLKQTDDILLLDDWLPITYHMNFTQEYVNIILHGSPVVDTTGRNNYLISPIMIGALESYENVKNEDIQYNFGMTVGSDQFYKKKDMPKKWGDKTGTGITDFIMERTGDGVPYQAHGTSFHTSSEFSDKHYLGASQYTGNQHFSKIVITHEVQRERGMIQSALIGDRSTIFHLDEMVTNEDRFSKQGALLSEKNSIFSPCGTANISQEKKWVMFNINAPYWFANNSPNIFYGVALRKS